MNFSWVNRGPRPAHEPWTGLMPPNVDSIKSFHDVRALAPDVLPQASKLARLEAGSFARYGHPNRMVLNPKLLRYQPNIMFCLGICFMSDLPGFVTMPVIAYLLDQWFVEDES